MKLEELLLRHGAITPEQLQQALDEKEKWGGELGRILVDLGFISEQLLVKATARQLGIPVANPAEDALPAEIVKAFGVQVCERFGVIPVGGDLKRMVLQVATSEPTNLQQIRTIERTTGYRMEPVAATSESIERAVRKFFYGEGGTAAPAEGSAPPGAPEPEAPPASPPGSGRALLEAFTERLDMVEKLVEQLPANPHFASLLARLERLEQIGASEVEVIRGLLEVLLEKGVLTREEIQNFKKRR